MTNADRRAETAAAEYEPFAVEVFELTEIEQLADCVELQRSIWRARDLEIVPVSQLRAAQHAGGLVAGARVAGELVGFCYGFPALRPELHEGPGFHSHMTGVIGSARSRGVGRTLKAFQREWCLERGIRWMEWTFDPLRAANARFNLEHLGATVGEYLVDTYGQMEDSLNAGLPSDRLMARWALESERVPEAESGPSARGRADNAGPALTPGQAGAPSAHRLDLTTPGVTVAIPEDLTDLLENVPEAAKSWRLAVRTVFLHYLKEGYRAVGFVEGAYFLERAGKGSK